MIQNEKFRSTERVIPSGKRLETGSSDALSFGSKKKKKKKLIKDVRRENPNYSSLKS